MNVTVSAESRFRIIYLKYEMINIADNGKQDSYNYFMYIKKIRTVKQLTQMFLQKKIKNYLIFCVSDKTSRDCVCEKY